MMMMTMAAAPRVIYGGVLPILILVSLSSGVYVQRGSNITDCPMSCLSKAAVLKLYRVCGDTDALLLELRCNDMSLTILEPRLHYNTSNYCWTLTDARKEDSCAYDMKYQSRRRRPMSTLHVTVLDPPELLDPWDHQKTNGSGSPV